MTFFQRLAHETASERAYLMATPQIIDGLKGNISLATYLAYLQEAYHHVKHTVPLMQAARARLDAPMSTRAARGNARCNAFIEPTSEITVRARWAHAQAAMWAPPRGPSIAHASRSFT